MESKRNKKFRLLRLQGGKEYVQLWVLGVWNTSMKTKPAAELSNELRKVIAVDLFRDVY